MNLITPHGMSRRHFMQHLAGASALAGPALAQTAKILTAEEAGRRRFATRCLAYSTRSRLRRTLSLGWNGWNGRRGAYAGTPVRLALHPGDALHPAVLAQMRRLLEVLLCDHEAMTKAALAAALQAGGTDHGAIMPSDSSATAPPTATPPSTSLG